MLLELIRYFLESKALNRNRSYWISDTREINNLYFEDALLANGETKEVIR